MDALLLYNAYLLSLIKNIFTYNFKIVYYKTMIINLESITDYAECIRTLLELDKKMLLTEKELFSRKHHASEHLAILISPLDDAIFLRYDYRHNSTCYEVSSEYQSLNYKIVWISGKVGRELILSNEIIDQAANTQKLVPLLEVL